MLFFPYKVNQKKKCILQLVKYKVEYKMDTIYSKLSNAMFCENYAFGPSIMGFVTLWSLNVKNFWFGT